MGTLATIDPASDHPLGVLDRNATVRTLHEDDGGDDRHHHQQDQEQHENAEFTLADELGRRGHR